MFHGAQAELASAVTPDNSSDWCQSSALRSSWNFSKTDICDPVADDFSAVSSLAAVKQPNDWT